MSLHKERPSEKHALYTKRMVGKTIIKNYMKPKGMNANDLARAIKLSPRKVKKILTGYDPITPDIAIRLSIVFDTSPDHWMNLQLFYDYCRSREENKDLYSQIKPWSQQKHH